MLRAVAVIAACVALAGCGGRLAEYGFELADAKTNVDGQAFTLWAHPREDVVLVQRDGVALMGQSAVEGASWGIANLKEPEQVWRKAAEWLLEPPGCSITQFYEMGRTAYEAAYVCPDGLILRDVMQQHRARLREGIPLPVRPLDAQ